MCSSLPTVPVQISNTCTDTFSLWPPHISSPGPAQQLLREVCHVLAASQVLRQKLPARRSLPLEILQTQRETTAPSREAAAKGSPGSKEDKNGQVRGIRAPRRQRCVRWGQRCVRCVREGGKDRVTSPCPTAVGCFLLTTDYHAGRALSPQPAVHTRQHSECHTSLGFGDCQMPWMGPPLQHHYEQLHCPTNALSSISHGPHIRQCLH